MHGRNKWKKEKKMFRVVSFSFRFELGGMCLLRCVSFDAPFRACWLILEAPPIPRPRYPGPGSPFLGLVFWRPSASSANQPDFLFCFLTLLLTFSLNKLRPSLSLVTVPNISILKNTNIQKDSSDQKKILSSVLWILS